ncbi:alkaline phosphatase family protein [Brachybacterium huguangmaarense]
MTTAPWPADLLPPPYAGGARAAVPELLKPLFPGEPAADDGVADVVVLLDGVGAELLEDHYSLAPTLRALRGTTERVRTVFPATTAAAITSLTTGTPPLEHGVLGYTVLDPDGDGPLQQLTGAPGVDPEAWMPLTSPAQLSPRRAVHVGPRQHEGSFLTRAAYRGWRFTPHGRREDRVDAVRLALRRTEGRGVVFVHVDDVDHAGHRHGTASEAWREALAEADAVCGALLRRLPTGTRVTVTADHGMVDTAPDLVIDLAAHPSIHARIAHAAGESRCLVLKLSDPLDAPAQQAAVQDLLGERGLVLTRDEVLAAGLYGPPTALDDVPERVAARLGDLVVLARGRWTVTDSILRPAHEHPEVGVHGSLTSAEALVPLVRAEA